MLLPGRLDQTQLLLQVGCGALRFPPKRPTGPEENNHEQADHTACCVRDFIRKDTAEANSSWLKIGVAFVHKDGKGFDIALDALPVKGRVVLRLIQAKPKAEA